VPIAYLADRAQKILGHPRTLGTNWAGSAASWPSSTARCLKTSGSPTSRRISSTIQGAPHRGPCRSATSRLQRQPDSNFIQAGRAAALDHPDLFEACKAPPLPPSEYQLLFTLIATEVQPSAALRQSRRRNRSVARAESGRPAHCPEGCGLRARCRGRDRPLA